MRANFDANLMVRSLLAVSSLLILITNQSSPPLATQTYTSIGSCDSAG